MLFLVLSLAAVLGQAVSKETVSVPECSGAHRGKFPEKLFLDGQTRITDPSGHGPVVERRKASGFGPLGPPPHAGSAEPAANQEAEYRIHLSRGRAAQHKATRSSVQTRYSPVVEEAPHGRGGDNAETRLRA